MRLDWSVDSTNRLHIKTSMLDYHPRWIQYHFCWPGNIKGHFYLSKKRGNLHSSVLWTLWSFCTSVDNHNHTCNRCCSSKKYSNSKFQIKSEKLISKLAVIFALHHEKVSYIYPFISHAIIYHRSCYIHDQTHSSKFILLKSDFNWTIIAILMYLE